MSFQFLGFRFHCRNCHRPFDVPAAAYNPAKPGPVTCPHCQARGTPDA